jgi:hypothetical protein
MDGSVAAGAETVQHAASDHGARGVDNGANEPAAGDADAAAWAADAAGTPGRAACITLGQLARDSARPPLSVSVAARMHSVPAPQASLPPSMRNLPRVRQASSVCSSGTFSRRGLRRE